MSICAILLCAKKLTQCSVAFMKIIQPLLLLNCTFTKIYCIVSCVSTNPMCIL
ncbi:hypothetical protein BX070DRAFT_225299 [Coemansia spiralis]|nr:hypothetical protein BX070DRAFT_225299 [Coemansia spiralis]